MEYIDLVNRIISAEHSASALAQEAREKQASLDADLERECAQLRQRYLERAQRRISIVEETEARLAAESMAAVDARLSHAMEALEGAYRAHQQEWVDVLFARVVGQTP